MTIDLTTKPRANHQPREHAVRCTRCLTSTWEHNAICVPCQVKADR